MGKPPEGGAFCLTLAPSILAICVLSVSARINSDYGCPAQEKIVPCRCSTRGMEFQIWCSHSELPSVLEGLKAVSHYVTRPVDELILENNNLPSLPGNVFTSLRVLRLMLRNNRLERVSSSWLEGLNDSLLELFVVEPDLRSLPNDSLENLNALEAVTLQSKWMKKLPRLGGLSKLRYVQVNSPGLVELSSINFRDLGNLEQLHVFGSPKLSRLEAGLLRNLPRLAMLNISFTGLAWIHPRAFIDLPVLKEISLNDNEIFDGSIVGRAIVDLPSLSVVNLDGNRISRLAEASFVDNRSLKRLSIARNDITDITDGAFQRLTNLRVLDLSHNRIRRIAPRFFSRITDSRLEEIWLIDNEIRHYKELRSVVEALPGLKFLDASHNLIEEIPYGALRGHSTLERLHLDHNRLRFLQRDSFVAMPALRELRLRNNSLHDLTDSPFWNLPGLKGLDLSENYFRHLGPRLFANLPNLRRLDVSGNGITYIEPESFMNTGSLEHINISGNALSTVHPMTFRHLSNLYELDIGWNRLLEMVPGLPKNIEHLHLPMNRIVSLPILESRDLALGRLRSLDISANGIERIKPGSLADLTDLRNLNIGYNSLPIIEDATFLGLARLEKLDLRYNRIVSLNGRAFKPLRNIVDLNLRGNRLEIIRADLLNENSQLRIIDISRNNLAQIPHSTFSNTRDLRELYASHNTLTELPMSLHGLNALEVLDLSFNKLNILSPETLSSLTSLLELKLVKNRIKELREGAFDRLPRLSLIDLENNDLRVVERNAVRLLPELQSLRLGKNRLTNIPDAAFTDLPLLQSAELQENRIQEMSKNAFVNVPNLLFLNLSHNRLPEIDRVGLESLGSLEVLDLSNNRLSRIANDSLASMEWLVELKMDNNRICSVQGSPFDGMPRLRVLSLRSNRMTSVKEKAFKKLRSNIAVLDIDGNPLSCSCGMLWLRGWLQQASAEGPRCADGSLFREIRLSRQDCQRTRETEPISGCEAETILSDQNDNLTPGDSYERWTSLRKPSKDHQTSENLDYLIYEDYPNIGTEITKENGERVEASSLSAIPLATSHVIPPPTPVGQESAVTQLSSNGGKNSNTKKGPSSNKNNSNVTGSPSSSGFTFFGVPLPSINFNLWGNSGSRKAQRKQDVDKASGRPGRSRYRVYPPTEPEIHRGGFVPLPQGQGGFVPIPDPRLSYERKSSKGNETRERSSNRTATVTRVFQMPGRKKNEKISASSEGKSIVSLVGKLSVEQVDKEDTESRVDADAQLSSTNTRKVPLNSTKTRWKSYEVSESQLKGEKTLPTMQISSLPTEQNFLPTVLPSESVSLPTESSSLPTELGGTEIHENDSDDKILVDKTVSRGSWTSPRSSEIAKMENPSDNDVNISRDNSTLKKIGISEIESRLPLGKFISAESVDNGDFLDNRPSVTEEIVGDKLPGDSQSTEILKASALSALLIPGGQISVSSSSKPPSGRSTIVKVASPHLSLMADPHLLTDENLSNSTEVGILQENIIKTNFSIDQSLVISEDNPFNWYFQNYNSSNIEPYVAVVYSGVSGTLVSAFTFYLTQIYLAARPFLST